MATPARDHVAVRNAADRKQVRHAARSSKQDEEQLRGAYLDVMRTPSGRRVMWDMLERCKIHESVFDPHGSWMAYNAGRQDVGHELEAELARLDTRLFLDMEREARLRQATSDAEREAFQVTRTAERAADDGDD
jgi:hypothetical protein